jgi:transcription elongation factor GreA
MADDKPVYLTESGMKELQEELKHLREVRRPEVASRIGQAKEYGDISENAEYEDAKNEQAFIEGRIRTIEDLLNRARLIKEDRSASNGGIVRLGSRVTTVDDTDEKETWQLVSSAEANPVQGKISDESPVGRALLGRRVGDQVSVRALAGMLNFKIVAVD